MATHSSILAWRIPRTEEPGRLQSMGSQRVGHDWVTSLSLSGDNFIMASILERINIICSLKGREIEYFCFFQKFSSIWKSWIKSCSEYPCTHHLDCTVVPNFLSHITFPEVSQLYPAGCECVCVLKLCLTLCTHTKSVCVCVHCKLTRLLCPWNFPGKNTGLDCHFLLRGSSRPRGQTHVSCVPCIGRWILYHHTTWEAHYMTDFL